MQTIVTLHWPSMTSRDHAQDRDLDREAKDQEEEHRRMDLESQQNPQTCGKQILPRSLGHTQEKSLEQVHGQEGWPRNLFRV